MPTGLLPALLSHPKFEPEPEYRVASSADIEFNCCPKTFQLQLPQLHSVAVVPDRKNVLF